MSFTEVNLATLARLKAKANTTSLPNADLLVLANLYKDEICSAIAAVRPEAFNVEDLQTLTANTRTYAFDTTVLNNIVRVELRFSATGDYVLATATSQDKVRIALQESVIVGYYSNDEPVYFVRNKFIYILSGTIATAADGVKMVHKKFPADLAAMTDTNNLNANTLTAPGFPKEFNELWARRISIAFKGIKERPLNDEEKKYPTDLANKISDYSIPNLDEEIVGKLPDANERGDDGFNY